ncbi:MAG: metal-sensitive transcriptional regulator [Bacteroidota bacterium]
MTDTPHPVYIGVSYSRVRRMIISHKEKKEIVKRLHYIKGQLAGVEKMLNDGRLVKDVYAQLKAAERALHQAIYGVLDDQLKKHFAEVLAERLALCPGDCDDAERLQFLKGEFAKLDVKELIDELAWLRNSLNSVKPVTISIPKEVRKR